MTRKKKLFIVDDDPSLLEFFTIYFKKNGFEVESTCNSAEALSGIIKAKPHCILLDVMMPQVDGYQLIKKIRSEKKLSGTKIIVVTAKNYDQDRNRALEMGANAYFTKPINTELFGAQVLEHLEDKLKVKFWGTRGTLPVPGKDTVKYGGNTLCISLETSTSIQILDAGSGIKELSNHMLSKGEGCQKKKRIYITHPHWDHINAMPFFVPLYIQGNEFEILGSPQGSLSIRDIISSQMEGVYFPIKIKDFGSHVDFTDLNVGEFERDGFQINTILLNHPGNCLGYSFVYRGKKVCYVCDNEIYPKEINSFNENFEKNLVEFIDSADLFITDTTYTDEDYRKKVNWGHSCISEVCRIADMANVKKLFMVHHDPDQKDKDIQAKEQAGKLWLKEKGSKVKCIAPKEGLEITL